jgi:predicted porin
MDPKKYGLKNDTFNDAAVQYSRKFGPVCVALQLATKTNEATDKDGKAANSSLSDELGFAVKYGNKNKGIYVGLSHSITGAASAESGDNRNITTLNAQFTNKMLVANLTYIASSNDLVDNKKKLDATSGNQIILGFAYKLGKMTPKFAVSQTTYNSKDVADIDTAAKSDVDNWAPSATTGIALGLDYKLGKGTKAYVDYVTTSTTFAKSKFAEDKDADDKDVIADSFLRVGLNTSF